MLTPREVYGRVYQIREASVLDDPQADPIERLSQIDLFSTALLQELHEMAYPTSPSNPS